MRILNPCLIMICLLFCNAAVKAQEDAAAGDAKEDKAQKSMEMAIEMTTTIYMKMYEKAGLNEEQKEQIGTILKTCVKDSLYKRKEFDGILDADQKRIFNAAKKQAKKAKYDEAKAEEYAFKKLKLAADVRERYTSLRTELAEIDKKMTESILGLLTDEQKSKLSPKLLPGKKADSKKEGSGAKSAEK